MALRELSTEAVVRVLRAAGLGLAMGERWSGERGGDGPASDRQLRRKIEECKTELRRRRAMELTTATRTVRYAGDCEDASGRPVAKLDFCRVNGCNEWSGPDGLCDRCRRKQADGETLDLAAPLPGQFSADCATDAAQAGRKKAARGAEVYREKGRELAECKRARREQIEAMKQRAAAVKVAATDPLEIQPPPGEPAEPATPPGSEPSEGSLDMAKTIKICTVPGCGMKHCARGLCKTHYNRQKNSMPMAGSGRRSPARGGLERSTGLPPTTRITAEPSAVGLISPVVLSHVMGLLGMPVGVLHTPLGVVLSCGDRLVRINPDGTPEAVAITSAE